MENMYLLGIECKNQTIGTLKEFWFTEIRDTRNTKTFLKITLNEMHWQKFCFDLLFTAYTCISFDVLIKCRRNKQKIDVKR